LPHAHSVIHIALPEPKTKWDPQNSERNRFIFVGRLTKIKGLDIVIEALAKLKDEKWTLDVVGDGPERKDLESLTEKLGISDRVFFKGYSNQVDNCILDSSCLLFPSYTEGMPLALVRGVQIGIPVIASNIPSVAEIAGSKEGLIPAGDISEWTKAIFDFMVKGEPASTIQKTNISTFRIMIDLNESIYLNLLKG
jgi:glycosyltransferase involved in cell wall biosynthesis